MINSAFIKAIIPFSFCDNDIFTKKQQKPGWTYCITGGNLLLKHINITLSENAVCLSKSIENANFSANVGVCPEKVDFSVSNISFFCFDTGIGLIFLDIPFNKGISQSNLVNLCSHLRCCARHSNPKSCLEIYDGENPLYLDDIALKFSKEIFSGDISLFNHTNSQSLKRIDIFSAVLCEKNTPEKDLDLLCYRLSNAIDDRNNDLEIDKNEIYLPQDHIRWCFSKRGTCVVANLTGLESTNDFLTSRWLGTINTNYFYVYLFSLHQKYAIYNYLNEVAEDSARIFLRENQEKLIEFNSKYIFTTVSDENFIQTVYQNIRSVNDICDIYSDLLDELKRMFEFSQLKQDEQNEGRNAKFSFISLVISLLCGSSIIFETLGIFTSHGFALGFSSIKNAICTLTVTCESLLFIIFLIIAFTANRKKK